MNLIRTEAPAALSDAFMRLACWHLNVHVETDDDSPQETIWPDDIEYIRHCAEAAVAALDGPQSTIRRALLTQTWSLFLDGFPAVIEIPLAPVQSVESIKYRDDAGDWQTVDPTSYRVSGSHSWLPEIAPASGEYWPSVPFGSENVEVSFVAGYGDDHSHIPNAILQAVLELAANFYRERQPVAFGSPYELPFGVRDLLKPYRVFR